MSQNPEIPLALGEMRRALDVSDRLLVITGAGVSTSSGIGDYRDEEGQWKRPQPVTHQNFMADANWRKRYWARSQVGYPEFLKARPNAAHRALVRLERQGGLQGLITQNVDRLHQEAGHEQVIDLHGRLDEVICMDCGAISARADVQDWLNGHNPERRAVAAFAPDGDADLAEAEIGHFQVPACAACSRILKPHVVFFGDAVPRDVVELAYQWVDQADAVLVLGTSLMVYSSFRFVRRAHERGIPLLCVNRGRTRADEWLQVKVDAECGTVLETLIGQTQV